jgi:dipeptidyl aminopeptidase/acylaminoacyl peptidase
MRLFFSLYFLLSFSVFATPPKVPLEAYGGIPNKSMFTISNDGTRIAYREFLNNTDIMTIIDIVNGSVVGRVDISNVRPDSAYFVDNDTLIMVVVDGNRRFAGYRGRHDVSAAYAFNIKDNNLHQMLEPGYGIFPGQSNIGRIVGVSKDKKYAYMPAYKNLGSFDLYRVTLGKKRKPRVASRGKKDTIDFFIGNNDEVVARERYNNETNLHLIESRIDDEWVTVFSETTPIINVGFNGITPDMKHLVMRTYNDNTKRKAYYTLALSDGKIDGPIFERADKDAGSLITDINRVVHGVTYSGFTPTYEFFDNTLNAKMRGIKKAMPNNTFVLTAFSDNLSNMIFLMEGEMSAGNYILYKQGELSMLASARPDIPAESVHNVTEYSYNARDGLPIPSLLTLPNHKEAKGLPAIMMPHGGPESYDRNGFDWLAQYFANAGYAVIQPQFRGSSGFGAEHLLAGRGEWGRKMQDDLTDAVADLATKGIIDKDRVCIIGASYGGYAAIAGAAFTPDVYRCVVAINGVSDIEVMLKRERREAGDDHWVVSYWEEVIAQGDVMKSHLKAISPINHVQHITSPILLIHGENDKVVNIEQSKDMFDALKDANKPVQFIELDKGDHYLSNNNNRLQTLGAIEQFLKINLPVEQTRDLDI